MARPARRPDGLGDVGVKQTVVAIVGMERDAEEAALVKRAGPERAHGDDPIAEVEKHSLVAGGEVDFPENAGLVGDEEAVVIAGGERAPIRGRQAGRDLDQPDRRA